jgi:hypothetical protein
MPPLDIDLDHDGKLAVATIREVLVLFMRQGHDGSDALDVLGVVADWFIRDTAPDDQQKMVRQALLGRIASKLGFIVPKDTQH